MAPREGYAVLGTLLLIVGLFVEVVNHRDWTSQPHPVSLSEFAAVKTVIDTREVRVEGRLWSARFAVLSIALVIGWSWSRQRNSSWVGCLLCIGCLTWARIDVSKRIAPTPFVITADGWVFAGLGLLCMFTVSLMRKV